PDRVPQSPLPRGVHGGAHEQRHEHQRPGAAVRGRGAGDEDRGPAAGRERERAPLHGRREHHPVRPLGGKERRREHGRGDTGREGRGGTLRRHLRLLRAGRFLNLQQAHPRIAHKVRRLRQRRPVAGRHGRRPRESGRAVDQEPQGGLRGPVLDVRRRRDSAPETHLPRPRGRPAREPGVGEGDFRPLRLRPPLAARPAQAQEAYGHDGLRPRSLQGRGDGVGRGAGDECQDQHDAQGRHDGHAPARRHPRPRGGDGLPEGLRQVRRLRARGRRAQGQGPRRAQGGHPAHHRDGDGGAPPRARPRPRLPRRVLLCRIAAGVRGRGVRPAREEPWKQPRLPRLPSRRARGARLRRAGLLGSSRGAKADPRPQVPLLHPKGGPGRRAGDGAGVL
ncbi:MAG: DNA polymerase III alpha subunit, partial [uncultured Rubrobacteraceae bacterium]